MGGTAKNTEKTTTTEETKPSTRDFYDYWYGVAEDAKAKKQVLSKEVKKLEGACKSAVSERDKYRKLVAKEEKLGKPTDVKTPAGYTAKKYKVKFVLEEDKKS